MVEGGGVVKENCITIYRVCLTMKSESETRVCPEP